jgi:gluconolactonase
VMMIGKWPSANLEARASSAAARASAPHGGRMLFASPVYQMFDSLAVDAEGNVCIATLITGGITVVTPSGRQLDFVPCPDPYTTNICFGGPDLRTAFITLSGHGQLAALPWPRPGLPLNFLNK